MSTLPPPTPIDLQQYAVSLLVALETSPLPTPTALLPLVTPFLIKENMDALPEELAEALEIAVDAYEQKHGSFIETLDLDPPEPKWLETQLSLENPESTIATLKTQFPSLSQISFLDEAIWIENPASLLRELNALASAYEVSSEFITLLTALIACDWLTYIPFTSGQMRIKVEHCMLFHVLLGTSLDNRKLIFQLLQGKEPSSNLTI